MQGGDGGAEEAQKNLERLVSHDFQRYEWIATQAWTYENIGETKIRWARDKHDSSLLQGAEDMLNRALSLRSLVAENTNNPRYKIEPGLSRASIAAYRGTSSELKGGKDDYAAAAAEFDQAAQEISSGIGDERDDDLVLESAEYFEWAGTAYWNADRRQDADNELRRALQLAFDQKPKLLGKRKAFEAMISRLEQELQGSSPPPGVCQ